jgi:type II secretory pathway component PulF
MGVCPEGRRQRALAETLDMVRQKIAEGADIATPLKQSKVFPPVVGYMIGVGEESGRLEELLKKTARRMMRRWRWRRRSSRPASSR